MRGILDSFFLVPFIGENEGDSFFFVPFNYFFV